MSKIELATNAELREFSGLGLDHGRIALDTEFVGEGRYQSLLCLVQIAVDVGEEEPWVLLVDPLDHSIDPGPIARLLADPEVELILHAARQDIALLRRTWRTEIANVFDTQVAAAFAGLRAQIGYDALLRALLDVKLHKSASFTRWDRRPLTAEQLSYAREDVLHLEQAALELQTRLELRGRLDWARQECASLADVTDERDVRNLFERLPKIAGHDARTRAVALELVAWRERSAREADRPAQQLLGDLPLVEVARRKPSNLDELRSVRGLGEANSRKRAESLLAAVEVGLTRDPEPRVAMPQLDTRPEDTAIIALCESLIRTRSSEAELAYELLATRNELQKLVSRHRSGGSVDDLRALQGWRRELVGDELLSLLRGERALSVSGGRVAIWADDPVADEV